VQKASGSGATRPSESANGLPGRGRIKVPKMRYLPAHFKMNARLQDALKTGLIAPAVPATTVRSVPGPGWAPPGAATRDQGHSGHQGPYQGLYVFMVIAVVHPARVDGGRQCECGLLGLVLAGRRAKVGLGGKLGAVTCQAAKELQLHKNTKQP